MSEALALGRAISYCGHLCKMYLDVQLRRRGYDITPAQSHALLYLSQEGSRPEINQRNLERHLRLKAPTVNGIVTRLEEKGYITRHASPEDGRCRLIALTDQGRRMVETFRATVRESEQQLALILAPVEQEQMQALLSRMITTLENEVNHP